VQTRRQWRGSAAAGLTRLALAGRMTMTLLANAAKPSGPASCCSLCPCSVVPARVGAGAYEAELPDNLPPPDLCALCPVPRCSPAPTQLLRTQGAAALCRGLPSDGARKLLGYVMLSTDITDTPAYSGKPVVTLIGMDRTGRFVGVKVLKHSEPILLLGIPESALLQFQRPVPGQVGGATRSRSASRAPTKTCSASTPSRAPPSP
jgi:transcriptional regulator of nitric oxide reductase